MPHDRDERPTSLWKKEFSLRRKPKSSAEPLAVVDDAVEQVPASVPPPAVPVPAEPAPPVDHGWLTQPLEEISEPPVEATPTEETTNVLPPARPALHALPDPEGRPEPAPAPLPLPVPDGAPQPEPPPPAAAADPQLPPERPLLPDDVLAALLPNLSLPGLSVADPTPAAPAAPVVEPLPAAAAPVAPPEPEPVEASVPFYKRELSLGRGRGSRTEKAPKAEKPRKPRRKRASQDEWETPFHRRKLSFGRGAKTGEPVDEAVHPGKPKAEKAPRQGRERPQLRFARRPKAIVPGGQSEAKLVGLKIGSSQLAAARIHNGAVPELLQAVRGPLEPGIVVGGELRDPEALAVALKDFFKRHKLPRRGVRLGIANNRIGVRTFDVAGIDDPKQLDNAIKFRAQEVLPIPIEEAVLDYQILSEFTDAEGQLTRRVLLVVAYRELVDRYLLACAKAGIQVVGIDLEAFALLRALAGPRAEIENDERGALVAVAVGHERSTFAVSDGRVCEFTRVLEWGGWTMNVAIARALDSAPSEAEPIKRALSFAGPEELPAGVTEEQLATARDAAMRQLQSFARELVSSLQFYQNQPGSLGIGEIVVTGGTTHMPGFGEELQRLIGVPVRVGDPLSRVKVSKKLGEREQVGSLAVAIGLGIED